MFSAYRLITWFYFAVPVVAVGLVWLRSRRANPWEALRGWGLTCLIGMVCGLTLTVLYAAELQGRVPILQVLVACWWGAAVFCLLRGLNAALKWSIARAIYRKPDGTACCRGAEASAIVLRAAVLLGVGVPYVLAMIAVYRPRLMHSQTPQSVLNVPFEEVRFDATDGVPLHGWWIPATRTSTTDQRHPAAAWGQRTIVLCHGFAGDKATDLKLVRNLVPNGYNVLAFDFRAYGQSGGQFTTFGDLERRDVLGAVRWIRANHPDQARKIFGLGQSLGAVALIGAAADTSVEGQSIEAIAVYAPYDRLSELVESVISSHRSPVATWLAVHLVLPIAGLQVGSELNRFDPARDIQALWPRPILMIASEADQTTDIRRSRALYDSALQPKYMLSVEKDSRDVMLFGDRKVSLSVRIFFETERSIL